METIVYLLNRFQDLLDKTRIADCLGPLLLRVYLAPVFWMAGTHKLAAPESTITWFGKGLGLPFPTLMFWMASLTEAVGAVLLLVGLATRWISIPLMFTMVVAMATVHWQHGWLAIATADETNVFTSPETAEAVGKRIDRAKDILREHGNYEWLTEQGNFVILNNGIEFAATYLLMLLALFFIGGGRYLSADYWIARRFRTPD